MSRKQDYVRFCLECGEGEVQEISLGDEGWSFCDNCQTVEGDSEEITVEEWEARQ
jgi:hypothetical protein